jgi:hypothetical protein
MNGKLKANVAGQNGAPQTAAVWTAKQNDAEWLQAAECPLAAADGLLAALELVAASYYKRLGAGRPTASDR